MRWETVIGLEVHVQPTTRSKMFCGCANSFGSPPNTQVCPTCLGLPGALPVPNAEAVRLGVIGALALGCEVHPASIFARKNYFYPDLPKGYQISQFDRPLATGGAVRCESPERGPITVSITRLHLEEDAGKSLHDRFPGRTAVDLNRCGTPLCEIVSGPDLRSPAEARAYLVALRQLLVFAGVSDCSMEKGTLRVDANLSIRPEGQHELGTKTEVKNLNSFAFVEKALEAERTRQAAILESGGRVDQVTLLFNPGSGDLRVARAKEESHDYRYFPDPDLPPLVLAPAWIEEQRAGLPELPAARRERYAGRFGLPAYDIGVLTAEPDTGAYFEAVVAAGAEPKAAGNWVMGEALGAVKASGEPAVAPARLAELIALVADGTVSHQAGRKVFAELAATGDAAPRAIAERLGLLQVGDESALAGWVDAVLAGHPEEVARYRGGEAKLLGFFTGQVMKASQGKADPKKVQPLLLARLRG
ncbi:MAG TPA: Asp-tRNA(Asn)/Glu-tRNA(Gln) amidotransferase subunit GatB [Gemmatimonadales bacterium]|nr:Asp-tRNA(Asn)/Glu-tRNA(Gln) amidotransferase subunit GatB [Gemmatimonadales bacterium]